MEKVFFLIFIFIAQSIYTESVFQPGQVKVTAGTLIVRNIASQGGTEVSKVKRGDIFDAVERSVNKSTIEDLSDYWYKINLPKKKAGWVFGAYLTFEVNLESGLRWKNFNPGPGNKFSGINITSSGEILAGTESGVVFLSSDKGKTWRKISPQVLGINIATINKIVSEGRSIWIAGGGDSRGGVWRTMNNGGSWTQFSTSQGLQSNEIFDIAVSSNVVYAATKNGIAITKDQGNVWNNAEGDLKQKIFSIGVVKDGKIFAGTDKGLYCYMESKGVFGGTNKEWKRVGESSPNMGDQVFSISILPNGDIYAGSEKGLSKSNIAKLENWIGIGGKTNVNSILADHSGKVIVATDNGLNISLDNGASWVTYKKDNGLAGNKINQIAIHPVDKTIWVTSGSDGLSYHE